MQQRRYAETEQAGGAQGKQNAAADYQAGPGLAAPQPDDQCHQAATGAAEQQRGRQLMTQAAQIPGEVGPDAAQCLDGHRHRLHAHALAQAQHQRQEEREDDALGQGQFVEAGQQGAEGAAEDSRQQPGHAQAKGSERRCIANLGDVKTQGFEQRIGLIALAQIRILFVEQGDIHQAA